MRRLALWFALVAGACESSPSMRDGGSDDAGAPAAPLRSCVTELSFRGSAQSAAVGGEWNRFDPSQTPMTLDSGVWRATVDLAPGSYGYKIVVDGNWILDPSHPYAKFVGGVENSVVEVGDCAEPELRFRSLSKSADGAARLEAQWIDGSRGAGLSSIAASIDGAATLFRVSDEGVISVEANGLQRDKHRFTVEARDRAGRAARALEVPFWIEAQPFDFRDGLMYFAFTDRFRDGDPGNSRALSDVDDRADYRGGDFDGIRAAIEEGWFEALGVRTLWVSPPNANPDHSERGADGRLYSGYHGYWPTRATETQARFGSLASMKAMIAAAHKKGMRVVVDVVLNHLHSEHPLYQAHKADGWFYGDGSCVCGGNNCDWNVHALDCWFMPYLPDVNYENFDAMRAMIDDALYWAREADVDGFRVDAVKHFHHAPTRRLRGQLHDQLETGGAIFYLVGETFDGDRGLINSFISATELSAQFDFPLYFAVRDTLGGGASMRNLEGAAQDSDRAFGTAPMSPFFGNHDVPRFLSIAAGQIQGDGKDQAWNAPPPSPTDENAYRRQRLALVWMATQPGVPLLYYGDEFGLPGAGDPDNRRMMKWSGYSASEQATLDLARKAGSARANNAALQHGARWTLWVDDDLYIYARVSGSEVAIVGLNRSGNSRSEMVPVRPEVPLTDGKTLTDKLGGASLTAQNQTLAITLPAWGAAIWTP